MNIQTGIPSKDLQDVALALNKLLADEYILYTKTLNYHWNVEGHNFMEMHKFYEAQAIQVGEIMDEVAERIRAIGHYAEGRLKDLLGLASLLEQPYTSNQTTQLSNLLHDHETLIRVLRQQVNTLEDKSHDIGTSDFMTGWIKQHEKMAWMVRAYLL
jgi:starvation-inducible DNA-binding protein